MLRPSSSGALGTESQRRLPPVWVLGLTNAGFGLMGGFAVVTVPAMLAAQGIPGGRIAAITAVILSPGFWSFLPAPMLDVWLSRRSYALIFGVLTAASAAFTVMHRSNLLLIECSMLVGYVSACLYQGAVGGWMGSLIEKEQDGPLGMWFAISNLGAGGVMMLVAGEVIRDCGSGLAAMLIAGGLMSPMLLFLAIPAPGPDRHLARESFGRFWREVAALLKSRKVLMALTLFIFPSASFALTNVLGGIGHDFSASERTVNLFAGTGSTIASVLGSLMLAPLAKRFRLRPLYLGIGIAGGCFTMSLLLLPRTPWTFGLAISGENGFQALAFAAFNAITFEVIGRDNPLAATLFTLLVSVSNFPITYMEFVDAWGYDLKGVTGTFLTDAGVSMVACLGLIWVLRRWNGQAPQSESGAPVAPGTLRSAEFQD